MVYRDPDTGKFVSGDLDGEQRTIEATLASAILAADATGGQQIQAVDGEEAQTVDFGEFLEADEVFVLHEMQGRAILAGPTTATAESSIHLEYHVGQDSALGLSTRSSTFWTNSNPDFTEGIAEVNADAGDNDEPLWFSQMAATPSIADSASGLAAGSDIDRDDIRRYGVGERFDEDDEIYVPHQFQIDGVDDHAVEFDIAIAFHGEVVDKADC